MYDPEHGETQFSGICSPRRPKPCCTSVHSDPALHFPTVFGSSNLIRNNEGPVQAERLLSLIRAFAVSVSLLFSSPNSVLVINL